VREALAHPETKGVVQKHILAEGIRMTDPTRNNKSVFKAEMGLIGNKGDRAINESPGAAGFQDEDIEPEDAKLDANPEAINEVTETVNNLIRTNSLKRQGSR